jgi:hypothetical protein
MARMFRMRRSPTVLLLLVVFIQQISFTVGFIPRIQVLPVRVVPVRHQANSPPLHRHTLSVRVPVSIPIVRYDCNFKLQLAREEAMIMTTKELSTQNNEVTLQSLQEMLQRLRADFSKEYELKGKEDTQTSNSSNNNNNNNRNLSPDERAREKILCSRIQGLDIGLNHTHLGPSTILGAGRGLFASCDILEGQLITCYPGDALLYLPHDADDDVDEVVIWGSHVSEQNRWDDDEVFDGYDYGYDNGDDSDDDNDNNNADAENHKGGGRPLVDYAQYVCDVYSVLGNPLLDSNPAYSGHFANDYGGHHALGGIGHGSEDEVLNHNRIGVEESIVAYVNESVKMANAQHSVLEDSHMVTIATRDISKGDEIFVTYGMDYWMEYGSHCD